MSELAGTATDLGAVPAAGRRKKEQLGAAVIDG
jgi:hypothetical protein